MWNSLSKSFFFTGLSIGVWLSIFSSSWMGVWGGMELNLLCFISLLSNQSLFQKEMSMKYFLIQACASFVMLMSGLAILEWEWCLSSLLGLSLMLKSGAAPFHTWYLKIAEEMEWMEYLVLSTIQKISPLMVMSYISGFLQSNMVYWVIVWSSLVGAWGSVNEVSFRKLLAYSTIHHLGWVLIPLLDSSMSWLNYLLIYFVLNSLVIMSLNTNSVYHLHQMKEHSPSADSVVLFINLLSLGGLPPLLGFFPKWMVFQEAHLISMLSLVYLLMGASVVMLYAYLRLGVEVLFLSGSVKLGAYKLKSKESSMGLSVWGSALGLIMMSGLTWSFMQ